MKGALSGFGNTHQISTCGRLRTLYLPRARRCCLIGHNRIRKGGDRRINGQLNGSRYSS